MRTDLNIVANLPRCESGKSRDIAAAQVGLKPKTAEKALAVVHAIDNLTTTGNTDQAEELRDILNT
jgi:hypothetical protein